MPWLTPDEHTRRVEEARDIALRRLDRCAAPRAVLARTLERRGVDPRVAKEALDRLKARWGLFKCFLNAFGMIANIYGPFRRLKSKLINI